MKSHIEVHDVEAQGNAETQAFSIKNTARAFEILSSGLYSDKIGAIVRELSCNAHDSHIAAGRGDQPIEICLPTAFEPTFYVKDNGLGLAHDDVMRLYTTYFESTKTSSDDFIGQLGLGSKSPFSYASTFMVESRFNGIKRLYSCFKNEQNFPAITMMNEQESDESNGMTIRIAVRREDIDKFQTAAKKTLMYFSPMPVFKGNPTFAPHALKHTVRGNGWRIRDTSYYAGMNGAHVVQGFVAYPIDKHLLVENGMSTPAADLTSVDIDMFVPIGQVEVAASREALSYDKRTICNLVSAFEQAASEMRVSFQAEFDKCTTKWEVAIKLDTLEHSASDKFRKIFKTMHAKAPFQWEGADATTTMKLDLNKIAFTQISRMSLAKTKRITKLNVNGSWSPNSGIAEYGFSLQDNTHVIIDRDGTGNNAIREFLGSTASTGRTPSVIVLRPISKKMFVQAEIDAIVDMLGNPTVTIAADLPYEKPLRRGQTTPSQKRAAEVKLVFTDFPLHQNTRGTHVRKKRTFSRLTWEPTKIDVASGGYYVVLDRFTPSANGTNVDVHNLDLIISGAKELGLIDENAVIVGMNEKEVAKACKQTNNWHCFFTFVKKAFAAKNKDNIMYSSVVVDQVFHQSAGIGPGVKQFLVDRWDTFNNQVNDGPFKQTVQQLVDLKKAAATWNAALVIHFTDAITVPRPEDTRATSMPRLWTETIRKYEMLPMVSMSEFNDAWVKPVINYVNLIDQPS